MDAAVDALVAMIAISWNRALFMRKLKESQCFADIARVNKPLLTIAPSATSNCKKESINLDIGKAEWVVATKLFSAEKTQRSTQA